MRSREVRVRFSLNEKKYPKHMDQVIKNNGNARTMKCIYVLTGDTLRICGAISGDDRPKKFETKEGDNRLVSVDKRVKNSEK